MAKTIKTYVVRSVCQSPRFWIEYYTGRASSDKSLPMAQKLDYKTACRVVKSERAIEQYGKWTIRAVEYSKAKDDEGRLRSGYQVKF
jgi:hypothetical protein